MVSFPLTDYRGLWESRREDFCRLVRIPSVYDGANAAPGAPCGPAVKEALDFMRELCLREGFAVREYGGHAVSASWGTGERIDVVSHLDVVQVTDDWAEDPFSGSVRGGFVHGRGTQDMKSGAFLTFLALKLIKDSGVCPARELRLVYGTDEERTMDDMRHYLRLAGPPAFAFTPDGSFPMVNGEKGALMWTVRGPCPGFVRALEGGIQPNVIPPWAEALLDCPDAREALSAAKRLGIDARAEERPGGLWVRTEGKAAHASMPEMGRSAVGDLFRLLAALSEDELLRRIAEAFADPHGSGAGMGYDIPPMGKLSLNPGIVRLRDGMLEFLIDCRYPYGVGSAELTDALRARFPEFEVELSYDDPPTFTPEDDPFIRAMQTAYRLSTGWECRTWISGGVSYSKVFGRCVTFGPVAEGSENLAHQKNERISEADCVQALEVYHKAMLLLSEVSL